MTYDEHDMADRNLKVLGEQGAGQLSSDALDRLDQFHAGGMSAVDRMIAGMELAVGQRVLDVGAGLGGPARRIAEATGASVLGVDINAGYLEADRLLTQRCGLEQVVSFEEIDVLSAPVGELFDAAVTMHVQMSVADKAAWYAAIRSHVRPGGLLAVWEVCAADEAGALTFPLPWSMDGSDNHLVTAGDLRAAVEAAGFTVREWCDETVWVNEWFASGPVAGPALPLVLDQGFERVINFAGALAAGDLVILRGLATN